MPATDEPEVLKQLMLNGMNCARINFSHGTHEEHLVRINAVKKMRDELGLPIALLLDTKGPEVGEPEILKMEKLNSLKDKSFTLTPKNIVGDNTRSSITYKDLAKDVYAGAKILIDDGLIEMKVTGIKGSDVVCEVLNGGPVSNHKSINVPGIELGMEYMSKKDVEDINLELNRILIL